MILPIVAYGHPTLKAIAQPITPDYPELDKLLADMWETLAHSEGVGLAAPQVNKSIRLFIVDGNPFYPDYPAAKDFKQAFINAELLETFGDEVPFREGCLSLPNIYEEVMRPDKIRRKTPVDFFPVFLHQSRHVRLVTVPVRSVGEQFEFHFGFARAG